MKHQINLLLTGLICYTIAFSSCKDKDQIDNNDFNSTPARYSPKVAFDWMDITTEMVRNMKFVPVASARVFAYTSLSLYESQVPELKDAQSMFTYFSGITIPIDKKEKFYGPATANAAIAQILRKFFTDVANTKTIDSLETVYNDFLKTLSDEDKLKSSVNYGKQVADAIFEWSKTDGVLSPCGPWTPTAGAGLWEPTPPGFASAVLPCLGTNARTFNKDIKIFAQAGPPPAYSTDPGSEYYENADEVNKYKTNLTKADSVFINSWLDFQPRNYNTVSRMNKLQTDILKTQAVFLADAAVRYSKLNVAMFDAIMTTAAGKFKYTIQRPITYIRNVLGQTSWNSYIPLSPLPPIPTLPFPSYPSYLGAAVGAGAAILESYQGNAYPVTDATQDNLYGSFKFNSIKDFADKTLEQRIKSGQNFRFSTEAGRLSGKKIAEVVNKLPYQDK
ncbi:MAG: hypothetical protein ACRC2O_17085 [Chitinophagaceae bacterium]